MSIFVSALLSFAVEIGANIAAIAIDAATIGFSGIAAALSLVPESLENLKSIGEFAGKTTVDWLRDGVEAAREINELLSENANLLVEYRDTILWKTLNATHTTTQQLISTFNKLSNMIDDNMLFNSDNGLTEYGTLNMSNLVKEFQLAQAEVNNYSHDIDKLNKLYAWGWYNVEEYNAKLAELQPSMGCSV